jgi:hypothetical protein
LPIQFSRNGCGYILYLQLCGSAERPSHRVATATGSENNQVQRRFGSSTGRHCGATGITFQHTSDPAKKYIVESMSGGVILLD